VKITAKQWDDLQKRLAIVQNDVKMLCQVVRINRAIIQDLTDWTFYNHSPAFTLPYPPRSRPLKTGENEFGIYLEKPSAFIPVTVSQLFDNNLGTETVP
jgi:hypothetical protein